MGGARSSWEGPPFYLILTVGTNVCSNASWDRDPPWTDKLTNTTENFTFPRTTYEVGNNKRRKLFADRWLTHLEWRFHSMGGGGGWMFSYSHLLASFAYQESLRSVWTFSNCLFWLVWYYAEALTHWVLLRLRLWLTSIVISSRVAVGIKIVIRRCKEAILDLKFPTLPTLDIAMLEHISIPTAIPS